MAKKFSIADFAAPEGVSKVDHMEITPIPLQLIDANWKNFYSVDFQEPDLAESIEVSGLLTPLGVIRKDGGRYKLISGHRRLRALRYLHDSRPDGREKYATVPCVIYEDPLDADREELMLIHANAQRIKSGPEISKEAEKITEILTRMKENGLELPGRMRDRVAEALKVSSTRLARLDAIEHNLTYPGWQRAWEKQEINEAVAYRLSQLDYSQQMNAADWVIDHHIKHKDLTVKHIEEALAANALDAAIEQVTTEPPQPALAKLKEAPRAVETPAPTRKPAPDPMTAEKVTTSQQWWRSCRDDPPKGWMLAVVFTPMDRSRKYFDVDLMQWHDGKWWGVYDASEDEMDADDSWWMPAAAVPAEVWR